jgi:hypothetical protein
MSEASRRRLWHILYPNKTYKPKDTPVPDPNMKNDNDSITRAELKRELKLRATNDNPPQFRGYISIEQVADAVVDAVKPYVRSNAPDYYYGLLRGKSEPFYPGEKITLAELDAAFKRHGYADFSTPKHVQKLWDDIKIHREGFNQGDIVTSSTGAVFSLQPSGRWKNYTDGNFVDYDKPGRPLVKIGRAT